MERCGLMELPPEVLFIIASFLNSRRIISRLSRTSRYFYYRLNEYVYKFDVRSGWCKALDWALLKCPPDDDTAGRVAQKSIQAGASVDFRICGNFFLLQSLRSGYFPAVSVAAKRDNVPLLQAFVDGGADINIGYPQRTSPLRTAVDEGSQQTALFLLARPEIDLGPSKTVSDVTARSIWEAEGSILACAVLSDSQDVVRALLTRVDPNEGSPLHLAVRLRNFEMVSLLLSSKDIRVNDIVHKLCNERHYDPDTGGMIYQGRVRHLTPFAVACFCSSLEIVRLLHNDARVDVDIGWGGRDSAVEMVLRRRNGKLEKKEIIYFLIRSKKVKSARMFIFSWACRKNDYDLAREIIRVAQDHDRRDAKAWIICAKERNWDDLIKLICEKWDEDEDEDRTTKTTAGMKFDSSATGSVEEDSDARAVCMYGGQIEGVNNGLEVKELKRTKKFIVLSK